MPINSINGHFSTLPLELARTVIEKLPLDDTLRLSSTSKENRALLTLHPQFKALAEAFDVHNTPRAVADHVREHLSRGHTAFLRASLAREGDAGVRAVQVGALFGDALCRLHVSAKQGDTADFADAVADLRRQIKKHEFDGSLGISRFQVACLKSLTQNWLVAHMAPMLLDDNNKDARHQAVRVTCSVYRALSWPFTRELHAAVQRKNAEAPTLARPAFLAGESALFEQVP